MAHHIRDVHARAGAYGKVTAMPFLPKGLPQICVNPWDVTPFGSNFVQPGAICSTAHRTPHNSLNKKALG